MKKFTLLFTILVFTLSSFGQWSVGPKVGINFHTVTGKWSDNDDTKNRFIVRPVVAAVGSYTFTEMLSVSGEFSYETMGQKNIVTLDEIAKQSQRVYNISEIWNSLAFTTLLNFIIAHYWFAYVGPLIRVKLNGVLKDDNGDKTDLEFGEGDQKASRSVYYVDPDYNRRWDFGMYIGGGYKRALGPGSIQADLRFGYGLLDLNKFEDKEHKKAAKDNGYKGYHSMNISLAVAYMFDLGKNK